MKNLAKKLIPSYVLELFRKVRVLYRYLGIKDILAKNNLLKTNHDTVVILGNGPSLNQIHLPTMLADQDVIVMNSFFRHQDADKLRIVAYCVGEQGADAANYDISKVLHIKSSNYLFSIDFLERFTLLPKNIHIYFPGNDDLLLRHVSQIDLRKPAPYYEVTSQMAILAALYMGYKKIVLIGYDHNFLASGDYLTHFYDEDFSDEVSISKLYIDDADYHSLIQNCDRMWTRYKRIEAYAKAKNVKIINCGINSYLDVFSRHPINGSTIHILKHIEALS